MKIPTIEGLIERRILINFTVDGDVLGRFLPKPFKPILINGKGIAGICLIRLKDIRLVGLPKFVGIGSENVAHRIAVEWIDNGERRTGVYITRRDTNSLLNHWAGGRVFPGVHHLAKFDVKEENDAYNINIKSSDNAFISITAKQTNEFNPNSVFKTLEEVSEFMKGGAIGFSPNKTSYDGLQLNTFTWHVDALKVDHVRSSFFEDESVFPKGSVAFDNALLMRNIKHKWNNYKNCPCP